MDQTILIVPTPNHRLDEGKKIGERGVVPEAYLPISIRMLSRSDEERDLILAIFRPLASLDRGRPPSFGRHPQTPPIPQGATELLYGKATMRANQASLSKPPFAGLLGQVRNAA